MIKKRLKREMEGKRDRKAIIETRRKYVKIRGKYISPFLCHI